MQQIFIEAVCKRDGSVYLKKLGKPRRVLPLGACACEYISKGMRHFAFLIDGRMIERPWLSYQLA